MLIDEKKFGYSSSNWRLKLKEMNYLNEMNQQQALKLLNGEEEAFKNFTGYKYKKENVNIYIEKVVMETIALFEV